MTRKRPPVTGPSGAALLLDERLDAGFREQLRAKGDARLSPRSPISVGCAIWAGPALWRGDDGRLRPPRDHAYERLVGEIPSGHRVTSRCGRVCVAPWHVFTFAADPGERPEVRHPLGAERGVFWKSVDRSGECWVWNGPAAGFRDVADALWAPADYVWRRQMLQAGGEGFVIACTLGTAGCVRPQHLDHVAVRRLMSRRVHGHREGFIG